MALNAPKILIVEDNFYQSVALETLLQQYTLEVELATDGEEAFQLVKQRFEQTG